MRLVALGIGLIVLALPAQAANVLSVGDGDTITVNEGAQRLKVRLACIDSPRESPYMAFLQGLMNPSL